MTARGHAVKVLVVEDSAVVKDLLLHVLGMDPHIQVVGTAANGEEAIEAVQRMRPDVVTMDVNMPKMNGLEATRKIMETCPTPIVIVSGSLMRHEVSTTFQALEAGALAVVEKPVGIAHAQFAENAKQLVQTLRLMSEVKVVRRWPKRAASTVGTRAAAAPSAAAHGKPELVAVGASTGGPLVLKSILYDLPADFPAPILVVQHIAPGFAEGFAQWLGQSTGLVVKLAEDGENVVRGHVYIAPDGHHMQMTEHGSIALNMQSPEHGHRPAVSQLFRSVASVCGAQAVGVLLTGMGRDGADELKVMRERGALTIAQDRDSSVVHGMPGEAIRIGGALHVLPPARIVRMLSDWCK
jgi:two-component system chemotaxis response regulator CheB